MNINNTSIKLSTIWNITNKINSTMELNTLLIVIMEAAKAILHCEGSSLMLMDHENNELKFDIITGEVSKESVKSIRVPLGTGIAGLVAQTGDPIIVNDAENDARVFRKVDESSKFVTRNLLCVPMKIKDKLIGILEGVNALGRDGFTEHDLIILNFLSDQAAIAINNRQMFEELEEANKALADRVKELNALYEISMAATQYYDLEKLFDTAIRSISEIIGANRCSLFLHDESENNFIHYASTGIPELKGKKYAVGDDAGIMGQVFKDGYPVLVVDIEQDVRFSSFKSSIFSSKSFMAIPLTINDKIIGLLNLADKKDGGIFNSADFMICTSIGNHLVAAFNTYKLNQEILQQERIKKELETAVAIQRRILPKSFDNEAGIQIQALTMPARSVGGDYYEFFKIDEKRFAVLIADVSGKGIPAAFFAALSRNTLRAETTNFVSAEKVFSNGNKYICMDSEAGMFVTAAIFVINHEEKTINYVSAGHNEQIFYKAKEKRLELIKSPGVPLGVLPNIDFKQKTMSYEHGDTLVLFTDGVVEANNDEHEEFGEENFYTLVEKYNNLECSEMLEKMKNDIMAFSSKDHLFDDLTLMVVRF